MKYAYNIGLTYASIAQAFADHPALVFSRKRPVTHGDLNRLANRFASVLLANGLKRGDVIGIVHTKTALCYAAMLAALKIGIAYVNIDDQNPPARLRHILATCQPKVIVGEGVTPVVAEVTKDSSVRAWSFSDSVLRRMIDEAPFGEPEQSILVTGTDPAYIMYTSGSTGVPKGAIVTHANVLNFGRWIAHRFGVGETDVLTNVNPMYFDNSVFDFYGAFLNGAALAPVTRESAADGARLLREVEDAGCTLWFSVPSLLIYLTMLKLLTPERLPRIRRFVFGGEGYPKPELRKLFELYGQRSRLINVYGPTECTCMCSAWDVSEDDLADPSGLVTLGPIAENFSMLVLNEDRQIAPGEVGELCLLGPQVGLGYANDPERTASAFPVNPLNNRWPERMYRTGDLVRLDADGRKLHFIGRKDNQVKHMGYRIELEEIEAALNQIKGVSQSVVLLRNSRRSMKLLVAHIASDRPLTEGYVRHELEALLPPYMIPQRVEVRDSLPKNANGKVDRIALAAEDFE
jgi:D-alanine--poly(phosphoribitol) ligase subunit 1